MFYFLFPICPSLGLSLVGGVEGAGGVVGLEGCVFPGVLGLITSSSLLPPQLVNNAPAISRNGINLLFI